MASRVRFGDPVFRFQTIDSTMREAAGRAEQGAPEGTLILAEEQTAGRGRFGRSWVSEPGVGLYFSLVLRPPLPAARAPVLTLAMGLGVARGISEAAGLRCDLRWPNDVLLNNRKCSGVLVEMTAAEERVRHAIVGIGINVNQPSMPPELESIATSLRIETGCEYLREAVLECVLKHAQRYYEMLLDRGAGAIVEAFSRASSYAHGKKVIVENSGSRLYGTTSGLNESGLLLLRRLDGRVEPVLAGSVRAWEEPAD